MNVAWLVVIPFAVIMGFVLSIILVMPIRFAGMSEKRADNFQWLLTILITIASAMVIIIVLQDNVTVCPVDRSNVIGIAKGIVSVITGRCYS